MAQDKSPEKQEKKQKNGLALAIAMVVIYLVVLVGTLNYTGVIKFSSEKKKQEVVRTEVDNTEKTAKEGTTRSTVKIKKTEPKPTTTTTTLAPTTTTTLAPVETTAGEQAKLRRLVKIYEAMDAEQAAAIISKLTDNEAVQILGMMKEENAAEVLAGMDTQRAANLSKILGLQTQ